MFAKGRNKLTDELIQSPEYTKKDKMEIKDFSLAQIN